MLRRFLFLVLPLLLTSWVRATSASIDAPWLVLSGQSYYVEPGVSFDHNGNSSFSKNGNGLQMVGFWSTDYGAQVVDYYVWAEDEFDDSQASAERFVTIVDAPTVTADQTTLYAGQTTTLHVSAQDLAGNLRYVNLDEISGPNGAGTFGPGDSFDAASPSSTLAWHDLLSNTSSCTRDIVMTFSVTGTYTFAAAMMDDAGNDITYASTGGALPTLTITVTKQSQSIYFPAQGDKPNGSVITLTASATSSLPVSYSVSGPASLSGSTLTLTGIGLVTVTASQGGNANYAAASNVQITIYSQNVAPTFSPDAGTYTAVQTVTISTIASGATIRYTTNGSTPSETAGTIYSSPVSIGATTTLKAIAYKSGITDSPVASATYTINLPQVTAPSFSPAAGAYTSAQSVAISTTTSGATIRYTMDGSTPTETAGTVYSGPVSIGATATLKAIAYKGGFTDSVVSSAAYTINIPPQTATPSFSPAAGTYTNAQTVTISAATSGASIRYTTDGSTPTETAGTIYSSPVSIGATTTLKAIAYRSGFVDSAVASAAYTINILPQAAAPGFSPVAGAYSSAQTVTISTTTSGASIRYTTDGSAPSETAGTIYSGPVSIGSTATLKAIAYKAGFTDSTVSSGLYTINIPQVAMPTFSPGAGAYTSAQSVAISTTTSGATIRYTTDGSTPSETAGTVYSSPVSIGVPTTLKAVAYKSGMTDSNIAGGLYTFNTANSSGQVNLPYMTNFEQPYGFTPGSLNGQHGWLVLNGSASITNTLSFFGAQSVMLQPGSSVPEIGIPFAPPSPAQPVIYADCVVKPVASTFLSSYIYLDTSLIVFVRNGTQGQIFTFDGTNFTPTAAVFPLNSDDTSANWMRLTFRLNFTAKTWDLYYNGIFVAKDVAFLDANATSVPFFIFQGHPTMPSYLDFLYVGSVNQLFTDVNNDGIDDAWETAHGLSTSVNQRNLDPDGDGVTNLQEYIQGTDPQKKDAPSVGFALFSPVR